MLKLGAKRFLKRERRRLSSRISMAIVNCEERSPQTMSEPKQESWAEYYQRVFAAGNPWLDYSNAHVQGQTFGVAIEAGGPINGKRCLDLGCGRGHLSLALAGLQASQVVGVDIVAESIHVCREKYPSVRWEVGTPENEGFCQTLGQFDVIFLIEPLPNNSGRKIELNSTVMQQYGVSFRQIVDDMLDQYEMTDIHLIAKDKGALEPTIKARL